MDFRTEILLKHLGDFNPGDRILTIGSCFAESIGNRFLDNKFQALINPFGTTYHPFSIHKILRYALKNEGPDDQAFLTNNDLHFHYDFHSSFYGNNVTDLKDKIIKSINDTNSYLKKCDILILTYGTSWIYERADNGEAVANCHKKPSAQFRKRLATSQEIVQSFDSIVKSLNSINADLRIILTVSPVRHIKDSLQLNNVSKSILRLACHELSEKYTNVDYFPAYEIMMDDLRDYRFYKTDMIHPTELAEDYIWERFSQCYFSRPTVEILNQWKEIRKAIHHRPFQPDSASHQKFLKETLTKLEELKSSMDVHAEIEEIKSRIS